MSAIYRIDVEHTPADPNYNYYANIVRLSDGEHLGSRAGATAEEARKRAQESIAEFSAQEETRTYYTDESGVILPRALCARVSEYSVRA